MHSLTAHKHSLRLLYVCIIGLQHFVLQELLRGTSPDVKYPITRRTPLGTLGAVLSKARDPAPTTTNTSQNSVDVTGGDAGNTSASSMEATSTSVPPVREAEFASGVMSYFLRLVTDSSWAQNLDAALLYVSNSIGSIGNTANNEEINAFSEEDQRAAVATLAALRITRLLLAFGADPNQGYAHMKLQCWHFSQYNLFCLPEAFVLSLFNLFDFAFILSTTIGL